jgi:hypothetical protein
MACLEPLTLPGPQERESIVLEFSPTLIVSLCGVLFTIAGAAVVVRRWGFVLVGVFVACMVEHCP